MPEDSVKFTVEVEQTVSTEELQKMIDEAVEKRLGKIKEQVSEEGTQTISEEEELQVPEDVGRTPDDQEELPIPKPKSKPVVKQKPQQPQQDIDILPTSKRKANESDLNRAATPYDDDRETRGGIYGGDADEKIIDFQRAKQIRGGLPSASGGAGINRDTISRLPIDYERWIFKVKRLEDSVVTTDRVADIIDNHLQSLMKGASVFTNPQEFVQENIMDALGNAARAHPIVAAVVSIILAGPAIYEMSKAVIQHLAQPGGPLNRDFQVAVETAVTGFLSLQEQHLRDIGVKGFVVSQADGYEAVTGTDVYNSLQDKDENRINRIPIEDRV